MNVTLHLNGNDISSYLISLERTEKLCKPGQEMIAEIDLNCPYSMNPWNSITIWEEGTKVYTGYISSVGYTFGDAEPRITVQGLDTWKRATDGWNSEIYTTNDGDTVVSMLGKYLSAAGLDYSINNVMDLDMPNGSVISYSPYAEIITNLATALGAFIRVDANGVVHIGMVIDELPDGPDISTGDNLISIDVVTNDYKARNKVIVWGPKDVGIIRSDEPWATVDHTMVIANPYISNASLLASKIHANVKDPEVIKTCEVHGDPDRKVGQHCDITSSIFTGEDYCTTLKSRWSKTDGYRMTQIFGERCAIFGKGAPAPEADGRDVIVATYGMGVWRCKDIWEGTPHWEPLNRGLELAYDGTDPDLPNYGIPEKGAYNCDWFIRDPFEPNNMAFLLTKYGIYWTLLLEPGTEYWFPILPNSKILDRFPMDTGCHGWWSCSNLGGEWHVLKLRSTVALRGRYYIVIGREGDEYSGWDKMVGFTNNWFTGFLRADHAFTSYCCLDIGPNRKPTITARIMGDRNYSHEFSTGISSWHHLTPYCGAGKGGLAAWHRGSTGCTITGSQSALASGVLGIAGPAVWRGVTMRKASEEDNVITIDWIDQEYSKGGLPIVKDQGTHPIVWMRPDYNAANSTNKQPTIHVPYKQGYMVGRFQDRDSEFRYQFPLVHYLSPGLWTGTATVDTGSYPIAVLSPPIDTTGCPAPPGYESGNVAGREKGAFGYSVIVPPWGGQDCHFLQGCISTYTPDPAKVYIFNAGKPSRFAISDDGGWSWTEKSSVPFKTACFSGFPYSEGKIYAGRDPVRDPTPKDQDPPDTALIYVSWDRGDTWHDVTGDLWDQTKALGLRKDDYGNNLGARGLVTIAPRYL